MRLLPVAVGILCLSTLAAAYTLPGQDDRAVRSDIQYIRCGGKQMATFVHPKPHHSGESIDTEAGCLMCRCGVCEALAKNAHRQVKALRDDVKPGKKVSPSLDSGRHANSGLMLSPARMAVLTC